MFEMTWNAYFERWQSAFEAAGLDPASPVIDRHLLRYPFDPERDRIEWELVQNARIPEIALWPQDRVKFLSDHVTLQRFFYEYPGARGLVPSETERPGVRITLANLWHAHGDPQKVCAALLAAGLADDRENMRRAMTDSFACPAQALRAWLPDAGLYPPLGYDARIRYALPCEYDVEEQLSDTLIPIRVQLRRVRASVDQVIERQVRIFRALQPVRLVFDGTRDDEICDLIERRRSEAAAAEAERERRREHAQQRAAAEHAALLEAHPRADDWPHLSRDELVDLVWSQPVVEIARDFGVSDVAIGKRCKALEIPKPPRGYWAKVHAGKLPHPCGIPQTSIS